MLRMILSTTGIPLEFPELYHRSVAKHYSITYLRRISHWSFPDLYHRSVSQRQHYLPTTDIPSEFSGTISPICILKATLPTYDGYPIRVFRNNITTLEHHVPTTDIPLEFSGTMSPIWIRNTTKDRKMARPHEIFSPESLGMKNAPSVSIDNNADGTIMVQV